MKTEQELNEDILRMTMAIRKRFPELSKYIEEMPVNYTNKKGDEVTVKELENYYNSLNNLFRKYELEHPNE